MSVAFFWMLVGAGVADAASCGGAFAAGVALLAVVASLAPNGATVSFLPGIWETAGAAVDLLLAATGLGAEILSVKEACLLS